jgi:thiamine pyrophosphate-dependent acetolactate synthase large subunit-like protein
MNRIEAIRALVSLVDGAPVLANLGTNTYDLLAAGDRDQNFYMWGAMGSVSSIGLGLALARPDLRVVVLDGDGSLLMNLGSLATIGAYRPPNLIHIVFDNSMYETTGRQATHTARGVNLASIARGAGLTNVREVTGLDTFVDAVTDSVRGPGPWFILAAVEPGSSTARISRRPIYFKDRFMDSIRRP